MQTPAVDATLTRQRGAEPMRPRVLPEGLLEHPGKWVAVKGGRIIEVRPTPDEVVEALHRRDITGATVLRVPGENDKELVGLG